MRKWVWLIVAIIALHFEAPDVGAQANGAHIDGIILDAQGLPLPGVKVTLTETQTGLARTAESTSDGAYDFASLNPGQYELAAVRAGFYAPARRFTLEVNQYLRLDFAMEVGPIKQAVEVVGR